MALNEFGAGFKIYAKDYASGVFGRVGKNFSGMANRTERDSQRMMSSVRRIGKGIGIAGGAIMGFGIPLASAIRASMGLNKALAEVSTLTDEANFPLSRMKELTKGLAAEYGGKAVLQAKALYQTISAGYGEAAAAAKMMTTANKLAVGGVTEVETAVDGLTNIMNTYKKENLEALDVSDAMFVAMKAGKTTVGELSQQIGRVAPGAESMGIAFDTLLAAISAVTSKGINTAQTTSGLAAVMQNIQKPTADAAKEAVRLGINFSAAAVRGKGFKGFLDSIIKSANYNEDSMAKLFGSIEAFKVMTALASNDAQKFNDVLAEMKDRAGATDEAVEKMRNTFSFQWSRFGAIMDNIKTSIGDVAEGMFGPILKHVNNALNAFNKFFDSIPEGVKQGLIGFATALATIAGAAGGLMILSGVMGLLGVSIGGVVLGLGALVFLAGPLMLMFGGLAVGIYAVYRAFKKNTGGITGSWQDMLRKVGIAWKGMQAIWKGEDIGDELSKQLGKAENTGVAKFLKGFENFTKKIKRFWKGLIEGFEIGVDKLANSSAMKRLLDSVDSIFAAFSGEGADVSKKELDEIGGRGVSAGERLAALGETALGAMDKIVNLGKKFGGFIAQISAEDVATGIEGVTTSLLSMRDTVVAIANGIGVIVNSIQFLGASIGEGAAELLVAATMPNAREAVLAGREGNEAGKQWWELMGNLGMQPQAPQGPVVPPTRQTGGMPAQAPQEPVVPPTRQTGGMPAQAPQEPVVPPTRPVMDISPQVPWGPIVSPAQTPVVPQARPAVGMPEQVPQKQVVQMAQGGGWDWSGEERSMAQLRESRENLLEWMNESKKWRKENPKGYTFKEASAEEQKRWKAELDMLERSIKAALAKPTVLVIDGEKVGESYQKSDVAQGTRDLDDGGALGF